jgi:hypothetical protein
MYAMRDLDVCSIILSDFLHRRKNLKKLTVTRKRAEHIMDAVDAGLMELHYTVRDDAVEVELVYPSEHQNG